MEVTLTVVVPRSPENLIGEYELWVVVDGEGYREKEKFTLVVERVEEGVETSLTLDRPPDVVEEGDSLTFTGRFTADGTDEGVSGALVEIYDDDPGGLFGSPDDFMASRRTDEDGYFSIDWEVELTDDSSNYFDRTDNGTDQKLPSGGCNRTGQRNSKKI